MIVVENHPKLGVEYDVASDDISADTVVPIEYDDTGNLVVEEYDDEYLTTKPWNKDAFVEFIVDGVLIE